MLLENTITDYNWLSDATNVTPDDTIGLQINRTLVENKPEFDGRFFVKVARDIVIDTYVVQAAAQSLLIEETIVDELPFYYLADHDGPTNDNTTQSVVGVSTDTEDDWDAILSPTGTDIEEFWFIDGAYYHGKYDPGYYNGSSFPSNPPDFGGALGIPSHWSDPTVYGDANNSEPIANGGQGPDIYTSGYNKGIEPDGAGGAYIYLSYGGLTKRLWRWVTF